MLARLLILLLLCWAPVGALQIWPIEGPHWLYIGPEIYHLARTRAGGTHQDGTLVGFRAGYDRIRGMSLYWGVDTHWAKGRITGRSGKGSRLNSWMTEVDVEGRVGYTLCLNCFSQFSLTPLVGAGYFRETNAFKSVQFRTNLTYLLAGFLSRYWFSPCWAVGLDFKWKSTVDGWHKILDDGAKETITLLFGYRSFYSIDLPIIYSNTYCGYCYAISLVPFYRTRHYGGRESFPFDFFDTRIKIYGARLLANIIF